MSRTNTYTQETYGEVRRGIPGKRATGGKVYDSISSWAMEDGLIAGNFGYLDFSQTIDGNPGLRNLRANGLEFTLSGNITTGNFQGTLKQVKFDGSVVTTAINVPYNTSHAQTITDILTAFNAITGITATATDSVNNRKVRVVAAPDISVSPSVAFAMSGGTPTVTTAYVGTQQPNCVIGADLMAEQDIDDNVTIAVNDMVQAVRIGRVYMQGETAMGGNDQIYARILQDTGDAQKFGQPRNAAGGVAIALDAGTARVFTATDTAGDVYVAEVNFYGK